jgi:hypothetical protein
MAYRPDSTGPVRDKIYPGEIAAQRPMMAPRLHCEQRGSAMETSDHSEYENEYSPSLSIRGDRSDDRCAIFNEHLREGLGTGRPFNNDE